MREKLIELLSENFVDFCNVDIIAGHAKIRAITFRADDFADYLISHGVTLATDNNVDGKKPLTSWLKQPAKEET